MQTHARTHVHKRTWIRGKRLGKAFFNKAYVSERGLATIQKQSSLSMSRPSDHSRSFSERAAKPCYIFALPGETPACALPCLRSMTTEYGSHGKSLIPADGTESAVETPTIAYSGLKAKPLKPRFPEGPNSLTLMPLVPAHLSHVSKSQSTRKRGGGPDRLRTNGHDAAPYRFNRFRISKHGSAPHKLSIVSIRNEQSAGLDSWPAFRY